MFFSLGTGTIMAPLVVYRVVVRQCSYGNVSCRWLSRLLSFKPSIVLIDAVLHKPGCTALRLHCRHVNFASPFRPSIVSIRGRSPLHVVKRLVQAFGLTSFLNLLLS